MPFKARNLTSDRSSASIVLLNLSNILPSFVLPVPHLSLLLVVLDLHSHLLPARTPSLLLVRQSKRTQRNLEESTIE